MNVSLNNLLWKQKLLHLAGGGMHDWCPRVPLATSLSGRGRAAGQTCTHNVGILGHTWFRGGHQVGWNFVILTLRIIIALQVEWKKFLSEPENKLANWDWETNPRPVRKGKTREIGKAKKRRMGWGVWGGASCVGATCADGRRWLQCPQLHVQQAFGAQLPQGPQPREGEAGFLVILSPLSAGADEGFSARINLLH